MPAAMKCSRCGKFYNSYYNGSNVSCSDYNCLIKFDAHVNGKGHSRESIDLCEDCKKSFEEWFKI